MTVGRRMGLRKITGRGHELGHNCTKSPTAAMIHSDRIELPLAAWIELLSKHCCICKRRSLIAPYFPLYHPL